MTVETQTLKIKNMLDIDGLSIRNFRGEEDYPVMLEVYLEAMEADGLEEATDTLEDLANQYNHLERCDPARDILLVEKDGETIAFGRCWWDKELDGNYRYALTFYLKPEWRQQGIGQHLASLLLERLAQISDQHPPTAPKFFRVFCFDAQKWERSVLESLGFQIVRYGYSMVRPCSQPVEIAALPEGIEVRPVSPDQVRQVWEAAMEAFRDHNGAVEITEDAYQRFISWQYNDPNLWKVAWDGEEVVGMVLNFINEEENKKLNRKRGYTEDISVRRPWRRKGIARSLLTQSIKMFQEMGMDETSLDVDTSNPNGALKLYQSVGYKEYRKGLFYQKEFTGLSEKDKE
jgi:ribosomal protein S18 acetylase RimI-like enzyme